MGDRLVSRAERLDRLERLLFDNPEGMRAVEIARSVGVDRRTVYRDVEALRQAGTAIWQEAGHFGIDRDRYQAAVRLSCGEAAALFIAAQMLACRVHECKATLAAALAELASAFPEPLAILVHRTAEATRQYPADDQRVAILDTVTRAWTALRQVRLWYRADAHPYTVAIYCVGPTMVDGLYLIGLDVGSGHLSAFKLSEVRRAQVLDARYTLPADFDPAWCLAHPWGVAIGEQPAEVVLFFSPAVASAVKARVWHPSQQLDELEDGACRLTMQVADVIDIRSWVFGWGADVQVLAPVRLREAIADEVRRMGALYA